MSYLTGFLIIGIFGPLTALVLVGLWEGKNLVKAVIKGKRQ